MIFKVILFLFLIGNYAIIAPLSQDVFAVGVPLSPQAQQANNLPATTGPLGPQALNNPYGFTSQLNQNSFPQFNTGVTLYTVIAVLMSLFIFVMSMIILVRYHQMQTAFVGDGRKISGRYRLFHWGKGWFDFRATEVAPEDQEETLEVLKEIEDMKRKPTYLAAIDAIIEKIREGKLHLYEIKVISRRNMRLRGNLGYSILITSEAIDNSNFFYEARNAVISPFSGTWREHPRIVHCLAQSRIFLDVEMAERNRTTTVYVMAPVSGDFIVNKQTVFGQDLEEFEIHPVSINVSVFEKPQDMAEVLTICRTTADTYKTGASKKKQSDAMQRMAEKFADDLVDKNTETTLWKSKVGERALVILGEKIYQRMTNESWVWVMVMIILGFIGLNLPRWIPAWNQMDSNLTYMILVGFGIIMKFALQKNENPDEKFRNQRSEVQMGSGEMRALQ